MLSFCWTCLLEDQWGSYELGVLVFNEECSGQGTLFKYFIPCNVDCFSLMTIICNLHFSFPTCCIDCSFRSRPCFRREHWKPMQPFWLPRGKQRLGNKLKRKSENYLESYFAVIFDSGGIQMVLNQIRHYPSHAQTWIQREEIKSQITSVCARALNWKFEV